MYPWTHLDTIAIMVKIYLDLDFYWLNGILEVFRSMGKKWGLPCWFGGKEPTCQCRRCGFDYWVGKTPWRRKWQPTPVFLPEKSHWQRSLAGYSPWGCKGSDTTERLKNNRKEGRWLGNRRPLWHSQGLTPQQGLITQKPPNWVATFSFSQANVAGLTLLLSVDSNPTWTAYL